MSGKTDLKNLVDKIEVIAVDTNVFIYYLDQNLEFYPQAKEF